jgi:hypothetical protein
MAKYHMVVQSQAMPGRDDDYNTWYDNQHFGDICALPGVTGGRRLENVMTLAGEPGLKYLAIYDIETDDIGAVMAEMGRRGAAGEMPISDALDGPASQLWVYKVSDGYN